MTRALALWTLLAVAIVAAVPLAMHVVDERAYAKFWRDRESARRMP